MVSGSNFLQLYGWGPSVFMGVPPEASFSYCSLLAISKGHLQSLAMWASSMWQINQEQPWEGRERHSPSLMGSNLEMSGPPRIITLWLAQNHLTWVLYYIPQIPSAHHSLSSRHKSQVSPSSKRGTGCEQDFLCSPWSPNAIVSSYLIHIFFKFYFIFNWHIIIVCIYDVPHETPIHKYTVEWSKWKITHFGKNMEKGNVCVL